jgi:hypothetical protein
MASISWAWIGGLLVAACASIPSVEYRYYLSKSNAAVAVTQAVACNNDGTDLIVVTTPTVNTTYSADLRHGVHTLQIRDVEGAFRDFADADVNFGFYDDGRLKSINQSTTGQGEAIIKSSVSLASALIPLGGAAIAAAKKLDECATIKTFAGDKPATVTYVYPPVGTVDLAALERPVELTVAPASEQLYKALNAHGKLPIPKLIIGRPSPVGSGARFIPLIDGSANEFAYLTLQEMGNVKIEVRNSDGVPIWNTVVVTPLKQTYLLPIPRAALFGGQKFSLTLSEAGAITSVDYSKTVGTAGALNAATTITTALDPETPTAKAAALKAQADVIAQQQRLVRCQTNPEKCQ